MKIHRQLKLWSPELLQVSAAQLNAGFDLNLHLMFNFFYLGFSKA